MRYHDFSKMFTSEIQRLTVLEAATPPAGRRRRRSSLRAIARALGVSPSTPSSWAQGAAFPRGELLPKIAHYFYPEGGSQAASLLERLQAAGDAGKEVTLEELRDRRAMRVAYVHWPPFSTDPQPEQPTDPTEPGFLNNVHQRFLDLGERRAERVSREGVDDALEKLRSGACDTMLGLFDTTDRALEAFCLHSPCRVSLNAVCLWPRTSELVDGHLEHLQTVLTVPRHDAQVLQESSKIRPIALRREVGYLYLTNTLGFTPREVVLVSRLDPAEYTSTLIQLAKSAEPTPVVVVDELTALRVVEKLHESGERPLLIFPLATERSSRKPPKRLLPAYLVGLISVSEKQPVLKQYLTRALQLLLLTEIEITTTYYQKLYEQLVLEVQRCLKGLDDQALAILKRLQAEPVTSDAEWSHACAIQYARFTLRLSQEEELSVFEQLNLPWRHILHRVRERIGPLPEGTEPLSTGKYRLAYRVTDPVCRDPGDLFVPSASRTKVDLKYFGFLGRLLEPFQHLADPYRVTAIVEPKQWMVRHYGVPEVLDVPEDDVRIGLFETLDRASKYVFFRTPYFMPLNAIVLRDDPAEPTDALESMRQILTRRESDAPGRKRTRPVVLRGGAAFEYLLHKVFFDLKDLHVIEKLKPDLYATELEAAKRSVEEWRVVVVDVMTCLQVLQRLKGRGRLVFPLIPGGKDNISMPEFNVGIGVRRESTHWVGFFRYGFDRLLREESKQIAWHVRHLYDDVVALLKERFSNLAGLDKEGNWEQVDCEAMATSFLCLTRIPPQALDPAWEEVGKAMETLGFFAPAPWQQPPQRPQAAPGWDEVMRALEQLSVARAASVSPDEPPATKRTQRPNRRPKRR